MCDSLDDWLHLARVSERERERERERETQPGLALKVHSHSRRGRERKSERERRGSKFFKFKLNFSRHAQHFGPSFPRGHRSYRRASSDLKFFFVFCAPQPAVRDRRSGRPFLRVSVCSLGCKMMQQVHNGTFIAVCNSLHCTFAILHQSSDCFALIRVLIWVLIEREREKCCVTQVTLVAPSYKPGLGLRSYSLYWLMQLLF